MSEFPDTLGLGQIISRDLKEEIERRYNTYVELERQLAKFNDNREAAYRLHKEKCDQLRKQLAALNDHQTAYTRLWQVIVGLCVVWILGFAIWGMFK